MPCAAAEMADVAALAALLRGEAGLRGEIGRAINDFAGEVGLSGLVYASPLIGERGRVRELWERGDSTLVGFLLRDTARAPAVVVTFPPRVFFATGRDSRAEAKSFSLSEAICIEEDFRFLPLPVGAWMLGRMGDGDFEGCSRGRGGSVLLVSDGMRVVGAACCLAGWLCFAMSSPMVTLRVAMGMRLTRRSIRDRRSAHWRE
jgi:hypothetical protein